MSAIFMPVTEPDSPKTGAIYSLASDFVFKAIGRIFVLPAGFEFDGASIPPILWPVIGSPFDPCLLYTHDAADDLPCVAFGGRRHLHNKNIMT